MHLRRSGLAVVVEAVRGRLEGAKISRFRSSAGGLAGTVCLFEMGLRFIFKADEETVS